MEKKQSIKQTEMAYVAPVAKAFTVEIESLICQSPGEGTGENGGFDGGFGGEE